MDSPRISLRSGGPQSGKPAWESNRLLRVGRLQDIEVLLENPSVSRQHAEVAFTESGWAVRDVGSTNGTFLLLTEIYTDGEHKSSCSTWLSPMAECECGRSEMAQALEQAGRGV